MRLPALAFAIAAFSLIVSSSGAVSVCIPSCTAQYRSEISAALASAASVPVAGSATWYWPILSRDFSGITSTFGESFVAGSTPVANHPGLDIAVPQGSAIGSLSRGTVVNTVLNPGLDEKCGKYVQVLYAVPGSAPYQATFCHLDTISVSKGDVVEACQKLGDAGLTGLTTGPHLHLAIKLNGGSIDPLPVLKQFASTGGQPRYCPQSYATAEQARAALGITAG